MNPSAYGGMEALTIEGNNTTGSLVQTHSAQQMLYRAVKLQGAIGVALDLNTTQDSWFEQVMINNCGSSSLPAINIYGSSGGTSNMLWFSQLRIETYNNGGIWLKQGSGQVTKNNGIYFSQIKLESVSVGGDAFVADNYNEDVHVDTAFFSATGFHSGYSTPVNAIYSRAVNVVSYRNVYVNNGTGVVNSIVNIQCQNGKVTLEDLFLSGGTPSTGLVVFASDSFNTKFFLNQIESTYEGAISRFVYQSSANTTNTFNYLPTNTTVNGTVTMSGAVIGSLSGLLRAERHRVSCRRRHRLPDSQGNGSGLSGITQAQVANLVPDLAAKAPLASPVFTGTPTAPTASAGDNSTKLATRPTPMPPSRASSRPRRERSTRSTSWPPPWATTPTSLPRTATALAGKVAANGAITGGTKTKITYDSKGLVTAGADATQDDIGDGTTFTKQYSATDKTKLAGIASGATADSSDATLLARANHTGTQTASTISDFSAATDVRVAAAVGVSVQAYDAD